MKKILVVTESKSVWGAERSLLSLSSHARELGFELHFLISKGSPLSTPLKRLGLSFFFHDFVNHPVLDSSGNLGSASVKDLFSELARICVGSINIRKYVKSYDGVLIFSIWQAPETLLATKLLRIPTGIDLHETFGNARAFRAVALIARMCNFVISPSRVLLRRSHIDDMLSATVVPRPVSFVELDNVSSSVSSPLRVALFGQVQPHKRIVEVARMIESTDREIHLSIYGGNPDIATRSPYEIEVRNYLATMNQRAEIFDFVEDPYKFMRETDVVINASAHEAFGRSVIEAVASGCYPVAVGDWGPAEIIESLGYGSTLEDLNDLPALLTAIVDDPGRIFLEKGHRKRLVGFYNEYDVAKRYFDIISLGLK